MGTVYISIHTELNGVFGIDLRGGTAIIDGLNDYNKAALHAGSGTRAVINYSLLNGSVTLNPISTQL